MNTHKRKRLWFWRAGAIVLVASLILILSPLGPIEGTYLSPDPLISKHEFLLFKHGAVYGIVDTPPPIEPSIVHLGNFRFERGSGWIWQLRGTERRIICKPYLLYMRFSWNDGSTMAATDPFRWRDPYFWKVNRIMEDKSVRTILASQNTNRAVRSLGP